MAKINDRVKITVSGGYLFATIKQSNVADFEFEGKNYKATEANPQFVLETVDGGVIVRDSNLCTVIDEDQFKQGVEAIIAELNKKIGQKDNQTMAKEQDKIVAELEQLKAEVLALQSKLAEATKEVVDTKISLEAKDKSLVEATAKLADIAKKEKAKVRADEMRGFKAYDGTDEQAINEFGGMTDEVYAMVKKVAETQFKKMVDTAAPVIEKKEPAVQAETVAKTVLNDATKEVDTALAQVATNDSVDAHRESLLSGVAKLMSRKSTKK